MFLKNRTAIAALIAGIALSPVALAPVAIAQNAATTNAATTNEDRVVSLTGDVGQVIVLRGNKVYSLVQGDTLFKDDKVITRTAGTAKIRFNGCERDLSATSSIVIDTAFCKAPVVTLAKSEVVGGYTIGAPAGVGANPLLIPALLGAGGVGAAVAANQTSASP